MLTPRLKAALKEVESYERKTGCLYWFREKSMAELQKLGLVETWTPKSVAERPQMKQRPWRITEAGRALLREEE